MAGAARAAVARLIRVPGVIRLATAVIGLVPPFEFVQVDVERNLHRYLGVASGGVRTIAIVGAWQGREIGRMLARYPRCRFVCFEPVPDDFAALSARFANEPRVVCIEAAVSDVTGETVLHELAAPGTSSLRPPKEDVVRRGERTVAAVRLDDVPELAGVEVDCIWVDVQGAESLVLAGAAETLTRTRSVFLEVWTGAHLYEETAGFDEIDAGLRAQGFGLSSLGVDPANGIGNALWVRR